MTFRQRIAPAAAMLAVACCTALCLAFAAPAGAVAKPCAGANTEAGLLKLGELNRATLCLVNQVRRKRGARALKRFRVLDSTALLHSRRMLATGLFGHQVGREPEFAVRIERDGFPPCGGCRWHAAENIAYGEDELSAPAAVVQAWMESAGHREALLEPAYRRIGIGILPGVPGERGAPLALTSGATYTVHLGCFCRP